MSKIKSVEELALELVILTSTRISDQKVVQKLLTQDRQAFEEAIVEALEGLPYSQEVLNPVPLSLGDVMVSKDRVKALVRSIYQDNK